MQSMPSSRERAILAAMTTLAAIAARCTAASLPGSAARTPVITWLS